jgi:glycosyltransferase involved in cell wall biosynthesis
MNSVSAAGPVLLLTAPARMGGLETVVATLARALAEAQVPVILVQLLLPGAPTAMAFDDIVHPMVTQTTLRRSARDYRGARADVRALLQRYPDAVVHSHGARADLIATLAGAPRHVSTVHGFIVNNTRQRIARALHLLTLRHADRVIAVSAPLTRTLTEALGPARVRPIVNAPPRPQLLARDEARRMLALPAGHSPVIGWIGRAGHEKGLDTFIEAVRLLDDPSVHTVVIGDGPELGAARQRCAESGIAARITFAGALPNASRYLSALDLLVLSSRTEGTPMNVLEAIVAGVPVVGTAVGGVPDLLNDGAGWLTPPENPAALAAAMRDALTNPAERATRAARATIRLDAPARAAAWLDAHRALYDTLRSEMSSHQRTTAS